MIGPMVSLVHSWLRAVLCKHEFAFLSNLCRIIRIVMMIRFSSLFLLSH
jgi:hypothetical protein